MSKRSELNSYIARLQRRLRLRAWLRGAAIFIGTALVVTVALVSVLNLFAFPAPGIVGARWALIATLAVAATFGLGWPLVRLTRSRAVREAEAAHPELEERLTTFHERDREGPNPSPDPFLELLAANTLALTADASPSSLAPGGRLFAFAGAGLAALSVLVWMIAARPGFLGYGASLLWTGPKKDAAPLYAITVTPGDVAVRRNSDQLVTAQVKGMRPGKVQIFAHYGGAAGWEQVAMQAQPDSDSRAAYQFLFAGLPENVEYYVAAGPLVSPHYTMRVVDLPSVKSIRVTYAYPKWTGIKPVTEEHTGDLRALEGTEAAIELEMDRPLNSGQLHDAQLTLDNGQAIHLASVEGTRYRATIPMQKDGAYHVAATNDGQTVRLSEDYFIATDKAMPPEITIDRPGGDYRASPIEEVTVGVKAADPFGLHDVRLHYSVNGGPDRNLNMLPSPGARSADGSYTLRLEDFKLTPGDLVSLYATAKDGHAEARTEISFIQAEPFEREFSQSQQSGGGGSGGGGKQDNQTEISKREKELIAATWKQSNDKSATPKDAATAGQFLSDAQQKLRDQVTALSARMRSRDLSEATEEFTGFEKDMREASAAMAPSADKLKDMQWKDAIPLEQKALQYLLRAEATFRKIEVAFGQNGGGGGGGGNSAGRDLASLFDLELDTAKNQYETAQTASPAEQREKDVASALEKLDALAKRQEELASQQHNPQQSFQERWQQEMLRREAEQLQRQMEQLAQNGQGQQGGQQSASGASSAQSGSQSGEPNGQEGNANSPASRQRADGQSGGQSSSQASGGNPDKRMEQALSRLRQANDAMKRSGDSPRGADAARQAADRLREAANLVGGTQQQLASGKMDSLAHEAGRLAQEERAQANRIDQLANRQSKDGAMDRDSMTARIEERNRLAAERQQLSEDLSKLQKNLRDAAREMASNQPGAAGKVRDALTQMDQTDLDNHVQRTADWLRRGINPNSNGTEAEIAQGLQRLEQQLGQAQQAMGQGKRGQQRGSGQGDQTAALSQVERLRSQLEEMAAAPGNGQNGRQGNGQSNRSGQKMQRSQGGGPQGQLNSAQSNGGQSNGEPTGGGDRSARTGQNGRQGNEGIGQSAANGQGSRTEGGTNRSGEVRSGGGGGADGTAWGNINTGNNRYGQSGQLTAPPDASGNPTDTERTYRQAMREMSQLRQMVQDDPQAAREVRELAQQMQRLDPSRFPGNPAMVEQMHREALSAVDRLELQLSRDSASTSAHSGKPYAIPPGYQDAVAEYYRRLSQKP